MDEIYNHCLDAYSRLSVRSSKGQPETIPVSEMRIYFDSFPFPHSFGFFIDAIRTIEHMAATLTTESK